MLSEMGDLPAALKAYGDSLAIRVNLVAADPRNTQWQTDLQLSVGNVGALAYKLVLARDFDNALRGVDQAIAAAPDMVWLHGNRAHALMFLNRNDEARSLYLRYKGRQNVEDGKSWKAVITADFNEFRQIGLAHQLMDEIERALEDEQASAN
jgi:tetratricopeptide (TPR) repeat protein